MCDKTRKQLVVTDNSVCISPPFTLHDRTILTTIISTHIFISILKKPRCIYITYPTVAKYPDTTAKGLGFSTSSSSTKEPAARLKHINYAEANNHDFRTLKILLQVRDCTCGGECGKFQISGRPWQAGSFTVTKTEPIPAFFLQKQTRIWGCLCSAVARTTLNNKICILSSAEVKVR